MFSWIAGAASLEVGLCVTANSCSGMYCSGVEKERVLNYIWVSFPRTRMMSIQCDEKKIEKGTICLAKLLDIALFSQGTIGGENTHILSEFSFSVG